jgi:hypothetical protein
MEKAEVHGSVQLAQQSIVAQDFMSLYPALGLTAFARDRDPLQMRWLWECIAERVPAGSRVKDGGKPKPTP